MTDALLTVTGLRKEFHRSRTHRVVAVRDVSLELHSGQTLAVVGESGSGKSTLGRMILGLLPPTSGSIQFKGHDITHVSARERRALSRDIQVIFQDPYASLNPRQRVEDILREPLDIHRVGTPAQRRQRVIELMDMVALAQRYRTAYPHELSGGLRQRVGIATALALRPKVIVADEPVSALDVSVQTQILELLADLRREMSVALLFISHDLGVVHDISDHVAVMCQGELIETGPVKVVYAQPQHPYTAALLSAILPTDPAAMFDPIPIGEARTPDDVPGCRFRKRCWLSEDVCFASHPDMSTRPFGGVARCHVSERSPAQWFTRDQPGSSDC
jgi:peptide/nickel transport system ATP-binding protein